MTEFIEEFYMNNKNGSYGNGCSKCSCQNEVKEYRTQNFVDTISNDCNECVLAITGYAQAYVPYQQEWAVMSKEQSLACGTAFAPLVMPYTKGSSLNRNCQNQGGVRV